MATFTPLSAVVQAGGLSIVVSYAGQANFTGPVTFAGGATQATGFTFTGATVASSAISGNTIVFTLAAPVQYTDTVTYGYTGGNVQDSSQFGDPSPVENTAATVAPGTSVTNSSNAFTINTAAVNSGGTTVTLTFNNATGNILPTGANALTGFRVAVNGTLRTLTSSTASTTTAVLTLASKAFTGDTITVGYTAGNTTDSGSHVLASTTTAITATGSGSITGAVVAITAGSVSTDGTTITLTFTGNTGNILNSGNVVTGLTVTENSFNRRQLLTATPATTTLVIVLPPNQRIGKGHTVTLGYDGTGVITDTGGPTPVDALLTPITLTNNSTYLGTARDLSLATPRIYYSVASITGKLPLSMTAPASAFYEIGDYTPMVGLNSPQGSAVLYTTRYQLDTTPTNASPAAGLISATSAKLTQTSEGGSGVTISTIGGQVLNGVTVGSKTATTTGSLNNYDTTSDTVYYLANSKINTNLSNFAANNKSAVTIAKFEIQRDSTSTNLPVAFQFTCAEPDVDIYYTFNGRTPHANPAQNRNSYEIAGDTYVVTDVWNQGSGTYAYGSSTINFNRPRSGGKYDPSNPPLLYENTNNQGVVIKVRAFKKYNANPATAGTIAYVGNSNTCLQSKIIRADVKITGGYFGNNAWSPKAP